jgi:glucose/arabinose dehydrogenase
VVFEADGGSQGTPPVAGGVYALKGGTATKLADSPAFVSGLAWHKGTLYIAGGNITGPKSATFRLLAWSGWNGAAFTKHRVVYTAPKKFQGFNGLAWGPDGRLYVGVDVGLLNGNDHGPSNRSPYLYDILSIKPNGHGLKVFATGMRQPWQLAFAGHSRALYVTDFGQDEGNVKNPPDLLLGVHQGDNYGFPACTWANAAKCKGYTKPFQKFPPHTDIGGIAIVGKTIYLGEFGFNAQNNPEQQPQVVTVPLKGGKPTVFLKSAVPIIAVGAHHGFLYVGTVAGFVYRVSLSS